MVTNALPRFNEFPGRKKKTAATENLLGASVKVNEHGMLTRSFNVIYLQFHHVFYVTLNYISVFTSNSYIWDRPWALRPAPPPQWYGSKTYILATFSWNPQKHMVFTMFWRARPPKPWYLQRFVILPLYTTTHIVLLLCINPHSRSPHLPPTEGGGNILDTT